MNPLVILVALVLIAVGLGVFPLVQLADPLSRYRQRRAARVCRRYRAQYCPPRR